MLLNNPLLTSVLACLVLLLVAWQGSVVDGHELHQHTRFAFKRQRSTTHVEDVAAAQAAAALAATQTPTIENRDPVAAANAASAAEVTDPAAAVVPPVTTDTVAAADPAAAAAAPVNGVEAAATAAAVVPCPANSGQFMWPANSGYCWYKRDTKGGLQGPGPNAWSAANVNVNSADQLVLTITNSGNIANSRSAEIFSPGSYGYGDYIFVVATNPTTIDHRLVGAPFLYASDTQEFDFEFARWNFTNNVNSQFVVQPYTTNPAYRFNINAINTTHRMRWTSTSIVFESYLPTTSGNRLITTWTYKGPNNFTPGPEGVHINYWVYAKANNIITSNFVLNCFKFCPQGSLSSCSTALNNKPRCSPTRTW